MWLGTHWVSRPPSLGFVAVQGYSQLVRAMLHSLWLGARLVRHSAAVIRSGSPKVYIVQWYPGLVYTLLHRVEYG